MDNKKLPFHLPAAGLLAVFIPHMAHAQTGIKKDDATVTYTTPVPAPVDALLNGKGKPLKVNGDEFAILPAVLPGDPNCVALTINVGGAVFREYGGTPASNVISQVEAYLSAHPGSTNNVTVTVGSSYPPRWPGSNTASVATLVTPEALEKPRVGPSLLPNTSSSVQFVPAYKVIAAGLDVDPSIKSSVTLVSVSDPTPVTSAITAVHVDDSVDTGHDLSLATSNNSIVSTAEQNNHALSQTLAPGETSNVAALLDSTTVQSTTTATLSDSSAAVRVGTQLNGASSVTVQDNSATTTARANDSSVAFSASGSNSGAGNPVSIPSFGGVPPTPGGTVSVSGDLVATGYQIISGNSDVSAATTGVGVGLVVDSNATARLGSGFSVTGNEVDTLAGGNRLKVTLDSSLSGSNVGATAYSLQTAADSNVGADSQGVTIGADVTAAGAQLRNTAVAISGNGITSKAVANDATTNASADLGKASNTLLSGSDQFLNANTGPLTVQASLGGSVIGIAQNGLSTARRDTTTVNDNNVAATAQGNLQSQTTTLASGAVNSGTGASTQSTQTLDANGPAGSLEIQASVGTTAAGLDAPVVLGVSGGTVRGGSVEVGGNTVSATAAGNSAQQALADHTGPIASNVQLSQEQSATGNGPFGTSVDSLLTNTTLGFGTTATVPGIGGELRGASLSVHDNALSSTAVMNQAQQQTGTQSGNVAAGGSIGLDLQQSATSTSAGATTSNVTLGLGNLGTQLTGNAASLNVSNNTVESQAGLNAASQTVGAITGSVNGSVLASADQSVDVNGAQPTVTATVQQVGIGSVASPLLPVFSSGGQSLQVNGNGISAVAQANALDRSIGAISGSVSGSVNDPTTPSNVHQSTTDADVESKVSLSIIGATIAPPTPGLSNNPDTIEVSNNTVQSVARQNSVSDSAGAVGGVSGNGSVGDDLRQTSTDGTTSASVTSLQIGAGAGLYSSSPGGNTLTVDGNQTRADAAGNFAGITAAGVSGNISAGGIYRYRANQQQSGSVSASTNTLSFSAIDIPLDGASGTTPAQVDVSGNQALTVASGNVLNAALGGVTGTVRGDASLRANQTQSGSVSADTDTVTAVAISTGAPGAGGAGTTGTVSDNAVLTVATGNSSTADLGALGGSLQAGATAGVDVTQTSDTGASVGATSNNVTIGRLATTTNGMAPITVSGNSVVSQATANSSTASATAGGSIAGALSLNATQSVDFGAASSGVTATTSNVTVTDALSAPMGALSQTSANISNNTVSAVASGNSATDQIGSLSAASLTGQVNLGATQSVTGTGAAGPQIAAKVSGVIVGPQMASPGGSALNLPAGTVDGNQVVANATGNSASHSLSASAGLINGGALNLADQQTVSSAVVVASIDTVQIGGSVTTPAGGVAGSPLGLSVTNNQVLAQALGNSSTQQVSLNGVSVQGLAMTSLNAAQSTLNSSITATVNNVQVGFNGGVGVPVTGSAVSSGNSVSAIAIGNSSTLSRSGH